VRTSTGFTLNLRNDPGRWLKQQTVGTTPRTSTARPDRLQDKDASDVIALMMTSDVDQVTATFGDLLHDERTQETTSAGLGHFHQLFGASRAPGVEMVTRALDEIHPSSACSTTRQRCGPHGMTRPGSWNATA
jgi:hypothetical protein